MLSSNFQEFNEVPSDSLTFEVELLFDSPTFEVELLFDSLTFKVILLFDFPASKELLSFSSLIELSSNSLELADSYPKLSELVLPVSRLI
jgi:hypothetical protein